jgi:hypothetical protein
MVPRGSGLLGLVQVLQDVIKHAASGQQGLAARGAAMLQDIGWDHCLPAGAGFPARLAHVLPDLIGNPWTGCWFLLSHFGLHT